MSDKIYNSKSLRDVIGVLFKNKGLQEGMDRTEIRAVWDDLMGGMISKHTRSIDLKEGKLIAVGTTSIRTLESLYWLGISILKNANQLPGKLHIEQWAPYETTDQQPAKVVLEALISYMDRHRLPVLIASTQIIIVPGYQFRIVDGMITNFHQPQSTLLLLISAYVGNDWQRIYRHALDNNYRFLSYGDSNLYLK